MNDPDNFLLELDGMIESTQEFILDDDLAHRLYEEPERFHDLSALLYVRRIWIDIFKPEGQS